MGGGVAGLTLATILAGSGVPVAVIDRDDPEQQADESFDGRTMAISYGSRKVLEAAGIWKNLEQLACPIRDIRILDGGSPVLLNFLSDEVENRSFGWILEIRHIRKALFERVRDLESARHIAPAAVRDFTKEDLVTVHLDNSEDITALLIVGADGRGSFTREWMGIETRCWTYKQRAIVCTVAHEHPHHNAAVEHFRPEGPFAILPMTDAEDGTHRSSVVWTEHGDEKNSALHYDPQSFEAALNARFPDEYGCIKHIGGRFSYPLGLIHAHEYIGPRMALVADAAHGIHPIAGQGLNMGLRDVAELAERIIEAHEKGDDVGSEELLRGYQQARRFDNVAMAGVTDGLNRLFSNDIAPVRLARKIGLLAVEKFPPAKHFFMKQAMGASGFLPKTIREGE